MVHRSLLLITATAGLLGACKDPSSTDLCSTGKCDSTLPPRLDALALADPVTCEVRIDTTTSDPFFQVDELHCTLRAPPSNRTVTIDQIFVNVQRADGVVGNTFSIEGAAIGEAPLLAARFRGDDYPIEVRSTVMYQVDPEQRGNRDPLFHGARVRVASRPTAAASPALAHPSPFDLWPVVLWPDDALTTAWDAGEARLVISQIDHGFPIASDELNIGGVTADTEVRYRRTIVASKSSVPAIDTLRSDLFYVLVPKTNVAPPAVKLTVADPKREASSSITGPGYYVIDLEARAVLTAPAELPGRPTGVADAGVPDGTPPPPDAVPPPDPCGGACGATQVCVAAACVQRADQTQSTSCNTPVMECDADEDGDCAPDHACVSGLCRRLTCQVQSTSCNTPSSPCDGEDTDCGTAHACVAGSCRRLTCQVQSTSCNTPFSPCGDDDDDDCGAGHACVAGLCRRLTCQVQSTSCNTPFNPCDDETSDCAIDHTCQAGTCARNTCL